MSDYNNNNSGARKRLPQPKKKFMHRPMYENITNMQSCTSKK